MEIKIKLNRTGLETLRTRIVHCTGHWAEWDGKSIPRGIGVSDSGGDPEHLTFQGTITLHREALESGLALAIQHNDCVRSQLGTMLTMGIGALDRTAIDAIAQYACFGQLLFC